MCWIRTDYDAFGNITSQIDATAHGELGFQGGVYDVTTGLYHFEEREYNPATGTWNRLDPKGFGAGQSNLYQFVGNGPTDGTDPSGKYIYGDGAKDAQNWVAYFKSQHITAREMSVGGEHERWLIQVDGQEGAVSNLPENIKKYLNNPTEHASVFGGPGTLWGNGHNGERRYCDWSGTVNISARTHLDNPWEAASQTNRPVGTHAARELLSRYATAMLVAHI